MFRVLLSFYETLTDSCISKMTARRVVSVLGILYAIFVPTNEYVLQRRWPIPGDGVL